GQDGVQPAPDVTPDKQPLRTQRPHQRVLHQIVGDVGIACEGTRIAAQRRDHGFDTLAKRTHDGSVVSSLLAPANHASTSVQNNTIKTALFRLSGIEVNTPTGVPKLGCTEKERWYTQYASSSATDELNGAIFSFDAGQARGGSRRCQ